VDALKADVPRRKTPHRLPQRINAQKERENLRQRMIAAIVMKREREALATRIKDEQK
jgi:hypothetical protein